MDTADAVIVGAGLVGLSIAYHLVEQGIRDVVVVERESSFGQGSSGRSAGGIRLQFGLASSIRFSQYGVQMLQEFEDRFGVPASFNPCGYLFLTRDPGRWAVMQAAAELQRSLGVEVETLGAEEVRDRFPYVMMDDLAGATFGPQDGVADPFAMMYGFSRRARQLGARILYGAEVTAITVERHRITGVDTSGGPIASPIVVDAAGPHARAVGDMAGVAVPVDPYRRAVYVTAPTDVFPRTMPMTLDFETTSYVRREGESMLLGMSDPTEPSGFDTTLDQDSLIRLIEAVTRWAPSLQRTSLMRGWAGLYEITPDHNPIIDGAPTAGWQLPEGFYIAAGFSGHGFQHAPAAGRALVDLICGQPPFVDLTPFRWARFQESLQPEPYVI